MATEALTKDQLDRFNRWYRYYPKKKSVGEAKKAWKGIDPDEEMTNKIINDLSAQLRYKAEQRKSGDWDDKFWPNPATWLRAEGWDDEIGSHAELKEKRAEKECCIQGCSEPVHAQADRKQYCYHHYSYEPSGKLRNDLILVEVLRTHYAEHTEIHGLRGKAALNFMRDAIGKMKIGVIK
jgi:hypothetical protein